MVEYFWKIRKPLLDDQKRFLLEKEDNGLWDFPGGGIDHGDNPID